MTDPSLAAIRARHFVCPKTCYEHPSFKDDAPRCHYCSSQWKASPWPCDVVRLAEGYEKELQLSEMRNQLGCARENAAVKIGLRCQAEKAQLEARVRELEGKASLDDHKRYAQESGQDA